MKTIRKFKNIFKQKFPFRPVGHLRSGFVMLFAIMLTTIILAIALGVSNIAVKEANFSTSTKDTNNAFFAADLGTECTLYNDKSGLNKFPLAGPATTITCAGISVLPVFSGTLNTALYNFTIPNLGNSGSCAKISLFKDNSTGTPQTSITAKGYNEGDVNCTSSNTNRVERELLTTYEGEFSSNFSLNYIKGGTGTGTVSSSPAGINACASSCSSSFSLGAAVTLVATPTGGSTFAGWAGEGCSGTGTCTVNVNTTRNVIGTFNGSGGSFSLNYVKAGAGSGTVSSSPSGINCSATCSANFTSGTVVTLTATPSGGSTFAGWSGDPDCSDGTVTMTTTVNCTGTFNAPSANYALNYTRAGTGAGTASLNGTVCISSCSYNFPNGTLVSLVATPSGGSTFAGWSGDADCSDGSVRMNTIVNCTATFNSSSPNFTLNYTPGGAGSGTVSSSPVGINNCSFICSASFAPGTVVTLTATPAPGSLFSSWSGDPDCSDGVVTMNTGVSCIGLFSIQTFALGYTKAGAGSGTVSSSPSGINACATSCSASFYYMNAVTLTATPSVGSAFAGWSGDADCSDGVVTMNAAHSCTGTFSTGGFALSYVKAGGGSGTVSSSPNGINSCTSSCSSNFVSGAIVTLTPSAFGGSTFVGWSGDADCSDGVVTMNAARSCTATFNTIQGGGGGGGGCFAEDTQVLMADGTTKSIGDLAVGDLVLGEDEVTGVRAINLVTKQWIHNDRYYNTLKLNGSLVVTPEHRIKVIRGGETFWTVAGQIKIGDTLIGKDKLIRVTTIEKNEALPLVYNLTTVPSHTYFAGGVLVHNSKLPPDCNPDPDNPDILKNPICDTWAE